MILFSLSRTALISAAEQGHAEVVEYLVRDADANIEAVDSEQWYVIVFVKD